MYDRLVERISIFDEHENTGTFGTRVLAKVSALVAAYVFHESRHQMNSGEMPERNGVKNGSRRTAKPGPIPFESPVSSAVDLTGNSPDDADVPGRPERSRFLPTIDDIKSELWQIGIGEGSESARVSALRALADIMGLMKPTAPDFPEGMNALLDALAEGLSEES